METENKINFLNNTKKINDFKQNSEKFSEIFSLDFGEIAKSISKITGKLINKKQILKYIDLHRKEINGKSMEQVKKDMETYFK